MKTLFITNVGSHAWGMNRPDSDIDLFKVYLAPSTDFLLGMRHEGGHQNQDGINDVASYELGMVIKFALKNNFNFLIGILSPIVVEDWVKLKELKELTLKNLSRECFYSIDGFYQHNYGHIRDGKLREDSQKKRNVVGRVLECGLRMIEGRGVEFKKPNKDHTRESLKELAEYLQDRLQLSPLPEKSEHEKEMLDWLLEIRISELNTHPE
jgi:hypothetical protein